MRIFLVILLPLVLGACTFHMCGNTEIAHQVGDGTVEEGQAQQDSATADIKANLPVR